ncbi:MAG: insulinase family protein [Holophagales bacterium]|nr:insulinase family protein [Holophagales bacterium]
MSDSLHLDLERHTLDNGLRVVLHRDPRLPLVAVNLWYHVGSKNERPGRTGFAHLFEHLLFQGSRNVDTNGHFRMIQQVGGVANGSTWYDRTNYYETLPSSHLDLGLWLESDRMGFYLDAITQEKLDNQRSVVINERRQRVDNQPYGRANEILFEMLFPEGHPYRWPVIGYIEDLEAASLDMVKAFFETYYTPSNAVLTVAGDIDYDDTLGRVERYFGEIPRGPEVPRPAIEPVRLGGEKRRTMKDRVSLPRVYLAAHAPRYGQTSWYAGDLLATVLTYGRSSLLYQDLVMDRHLAQQLTCYIQPTESASCFVVVATAAPGVEPRRLEDEIRRHLGSVAGGVEPERLERARNLLTTAFYEGLQSLGDRADELSKFATYFDAPEAVAEEPRRYDDLDGGQLRDFARDFLAPEQLAVLTVEADTGADAGGAGGGSR